MSISPENTYKTGGGAMGWLTENPFIGSALITLGGGILAGLTSKRPGRVRTSQEIYFDDMVRFYRNIGRNGTVGRALASAFTGQPADSFVGKIGYKSTVDAMRAVPYPGSAGVRNVYESDGGETQDGDDLS